MKNQHRLIALAMSAVLAVGLMTGTVFAAAEESTATEEAVVEEEAAVEEEAEESEEAAAEEAESEKEEESEEAAAEEAESEKKEETEEAAAEEAGSEKEDAAEESAIEDAEALEEVMLEDEVALAEEAVQAEEAAEEEADKPKTFVYEDDEIRLGQYDGLTYTAVHLTAEDADVDEEIQNNMMDFATHEEFLTGTAKDGDTVNIDFAGTIDGEAFEGGTAEGQEVTLGSGSFLAEFEAGIVGMEVGETKDIEVVFPDDYYEDLAGKKAVFAITLNSIYGEESVPELTDEFVSENFDCDTVEEYRESVRAELQASLDDIYTQGVQNQILTQLVENSEILKYDEDMIAVQLDYVNQVYKAYADMYGMDYDAFLQASQITEEAIENEAKSYVGLFMILKTIAKLENIEVTDEEYQEYLEGLVKEYYYDSVEDLIKDIESAGYPDQERDYLLMERVLGWVVDHAVQSEDAEEFIELGEDEIAALEAMDGEAEEEAATEETSEAAAEAATEAAEEAVTEAAEEAVTEAADEAVTEAAEEETSEAADEETTQTAE